jgi:hypothetical protein
VTATDIDLDALIDAIDARRRARAQPLRNQLGQLVTPEQHSGRVIVNPGDVIQSAWGNATYDQTVQVYANAADRDSQWPTPLDGSVSFLTDTTSLWVRAGGVWKPRPQGVISQAYSQANSSGTTATTGVTWYQAPAFTSPGGRRIKVTYSGIVQSGAVGDLAALRLMEGAAVLGSCPTRVAAVGGAGQQGLTGFWSGVPAAGTHTYTLNVALQSGTGAVTALANTAAPSFLIIEDIGT